MIALALAALSSIRGEDAAKPAKFENIGFFKPKLPKGFEGVECAIVRFRAADYKLLVIDNGPKRAEARFRNLADAMIRSGCDAGTNGGFFSIGSFEPNGLMISDGVAVGKFDSKNWARGILVVRDGTPMLADCESFELDSAVSGLLQTGPWLVRKGVAETGFTNDEERRRRTFIATDGRGTWILGYLSGSTLKELGPMLVSQPIQEILPIQDALNLDGGPSSGFWFRDGPGGAHSIEVETIVRNFVGIQRR